MSGTDVDCLDGKTQVTRLVRARIAAHIVDLSGTEPDECAIYSLSDPRDLRSVRYIGQTGSLRRRYMQHVNTARLWLPDELPWWVKRPGMRPLYHWIRELYRDECRLPVMGVIAWTQASGALVEERKHICEHLRQRSALLNRESEAFEKQLLLI